MFNHLAQFNRQSNNDGMPIAKQKTMAVRAKMIQASMSFGVPF